jgi:pimeloyl-ACP methyl ester carboxylesterase
MTERSTPRLGGLPDRADDVVSGLSGAFRPSQVDYLPSSVCWYEDGWLVSTDVWGDRRLARYDAARGAWTELPAPDGWVRRPMAVQGAQLCVMRHERHADHGQQLALRGGRWDVVADRIEESSVTDWNGAQVTCRDAGGHATAWAATGETLRMASRPDGAQAIVGPGWELPVPPGATLTHLAPSPDRSSALVVVRKGGSYRGHVVSLQTGRALSRESLREVVLPTSAWLDETRVVVVVEDWPSLVPAVWDSARGTLTRAWPPGALGCARSVASTPDGDCVVAVGTPLAPRAVRSLDDAAPVERASAAAEVRPVVVERGGQLLPCMVHEPLTACRGTAFYLPGGPHEPIWGEYAPLARAMNELGWRVVRVNVRSSGLRQPAYRPQAPVQFGIDDVADLSAVIDALADGPVVTMGMSYGGYLAALGGELADRCIGVAILSGFLHHDDLAGTAHPGVREFAEFAFRGRPPFEPTRLRKRYFIAHGVLDTRIPIAAIERHRARMDREPTFVPLDGEGHAIHTDRGARLTYPPLLRWLTEIREEEEA